MPHPFFVLADPESLEIVASYADLDDAETIRQKRSPSLLQERGDG
jgi:hypothetical protein